MNRKTKPRASETSRLDEAAWTQAALEQLAETGIDGVRVEVLAKRLEVTKGSFYWHFKDRDALYEMMLVHWRRKATLSLIERLDRGETSPISRLRRLLELPLVGRRSANAADVELAIRLWGRRDIRARTALEEVDQLRLRYIEGLLQQCGVQPKDAEGRAILAYAYMRVAATLFRPDDQDLMNRCEELLLGAPLADAPAQETPASELPLA